MRHGLAVRTTVLTVLVILASAAAVVEFRRLAPLYPLATFVTGWALLALMLALTFYNGRKKLPFIPLLSSRVWLQVHIYAGIFTAVVFLLHLNGHWPHGWFEQVLAVLFILVTVSGLFGWWISRVMPKRMTTVGGEVLLERIPIIRRDLRLRAETLVLKSIPAGQATTLADYYAKELSGFFAAPQQFWSCLTGSRRRLTELLGNLGETNRYLTAAEKTAAGELAGLIRQKDAIDYQRAAQLLLKGWLFVHIPLTYGLLVYSFVHVVVVYSFSGGAR